MLCFFFSSRRRHTRLTCDWSSDVCSSDLSPTSPQTRQALPFPDKPSLLRPLLLLHNTALLPRCYRTHTDPFLPNNPPHGAPNASVRTNRHTSPEFYHAVWSGPPFF